MGDYLLLAGPATQPQRLMTCLGRHRKVSAIYDVQLGQRLYGAARARVRHHRSKPGGARLLDSVSHGRAEGGAAFMRMYEEARVAFDTPVVILHDPAGPVFPFLQPPAVTLLVLVRTAESAAAVIGAYGVERVVAAARDALVAFKSRVAAFGIPVDRIVTVEEDRLDADPRIGLSDLCRVLGVASDPATVAGMIAPASVDARSKTGA